VTQKITTLSIMTITIITFIIMTLTITTFIIMTPKIMILYIRTLHDNTKDNITPHIVTQNNDTQRNGNNLATL
jgi:hypothetical protein